MKPWQSESQSDLVDAIEEGRIVKVPESYAKREGLTILRKQLIASQSMQKKQKQEEHYLSFDDFRKPLKQKSQVLSELAENFHWEIKKKRRELGITRGKLANDIGEPEHALRLMENGIIQKDDFVIINKLQDYFKINLRKDKANFTQSPRAMIQQKSEIKPEEQKREIMQEIKPEVKAEERPQRQFRRFKDDTRFREAMRYKDNRRQERPKPVESDIEVFD